METKEHHTDPVAALIMRDTQAMWLEEHPMPSLLFAEKFPVTRRECFKIPFSQIEKTETLVSPEYRASLLEVLGRKFPPIIRLAISHIFLNFLSPNQTLIQSQGRHLFMLKTYDLRKQAHCWFIPIAEVGALQAASSESMQQGLSYNDLALVQTYAVEGVLALHAETWGESRTGQKSARNFGECNWIGGIAFHFGQGDASRDFVHLGLDEMPDVAEKKNKEREKRQRKRAKQKQKKQDAKLQAEQDVLEQDQLAQEERRKGKIQVGADLGAALTRLAMDAKPSFT